MENSLTNMVSDINLPKKEVLSCMCVYSRIGTVYAPASISIHVMYLCIYNNHLSAFYISYLVRMFSLC